MESSSNTTLDGRVRCVWLRCVDGRSVGIVGNQPMVMAGVLDIESSEKAVGSSALRRI